MSGFCLAKSIQRSGVIIEDITECHSFIHQDAFMQIADINDKTEYLRISEQVPCAQFALD